MSDAPREKTFLLARHEGRVLDWLAQRLPARVMPDHMTRSACSPRSASAPPIG